MFGADLRWSVFLRGGLRNSAFTWPQGKLATHHVRSGRLGDPPRAASAAFSATTRFVDSVSLDQIWVGFPSRTGLEDAEDASRVREEKEAST